MGNKKSKQKNDSFKQGISVIEQNIEEQIEYALKIMDRTDSWINSCDNKLSVLLGIFGVVLTVCLTSDSINKAYSFIKRILFDLSDVKSYVFVIGCFVTLFFYIKFFYHITNALVARGDSEKFMQNQICTKSKLFFGSISERKYEEYKNDFLKDSCEDRLNDILSQVYINSSIAQIKHLHYNKSILWIALSMSLTFVVVAFGIMAF